MLRPTLSIAAIAIAGAASVSSPASAGSPCCCVASCVAVAPPVLVYEPYEMPRIYIVDQGPVYSGPGIYTNPTVVLPRRMPRYPYVGRDYLNDLPPYVEPLRVRAQYALRRRAVRYYK
ncbi:MAG: hypothetical protein GEU95_10490 [Rhizobiales bacterium]|nr:hypothetical protein [Hyphomicrobiales bacterium]